MHNMELVGKKERFQRIMYYICIFFSVWIQPNTGENIFHFEKKQYVSSTVESVAGQSAQLPCNMSVPQNDTVYLVLWFKEGLTTPIYSYDVRDLLSGEPRHWWDADLLGSRAFFNAHSSPAHLLLRHVTLDDAGQYKCRVDFSREPTRNSRVNLTVVVPPKDVVILDTKEKKVHSFIGPSSEGESLHLSCITYGGIPPPSIVWLINGEIYDDKPDSISNGNVRNDLYIEKVTRNHLRAELTCKASYRRAYPPFLTTVTLDMNLEPLDVRIHPPPDALSAGRTYEFICSSTGSRPPAVITWWKGSERLPAIKDQTSPDGNVSTSVIKLKINATDNGKRFACRAENKKILSAIIEDTLKINVYYLPVVSAHFGPSLDPNAIKEGDDVYFECCVEAHPPVYKIRWKHNDHVVAHNLNSGVLIANQSLVLQAVTRANSGRYTCIASNVEGDGESLPLILSIQYRPVCKNGQKTQFSVSTMETAHVKCQVEAVPQVTKFRWWFNNTAETLEVPQGRFTVGLGGKSVLTYTPTSDLDYGTLLCTTENAIGVQETPCIYNIEPATRPEAPTNCSILNISADSLKVTCSEGFDGGLNQSFVMEVYRTKPHTLHKNISSTKPSFQVSGLESDSEIQLIIYSGNAKGRSGITRLVSYTLKPPVKQLETRLGTGEKNNFSSDIASAVPSLVGAIVGGIIALVTVSSVLIYSVKRKCWKRMEENEDSVNGSSESSQSHFTIAPGFIPSEPFNSKYNNPPQSSLHKQIKCQDYQHKNINNEGNLYQDQQETHSKLLILQHQQPLQQKAPIRDQYTIPLNFHTPETCLTDIPPPPSQYASASLSNELARSFQEKVVPSSLPMAPIEFANLNISDEASNESPYQGQEASKMTSATGFSKRWAQDGCSRPHQVMTDNSEILVAFLGKSSPRRQSFSSIAGLGTISESQEATGLTSSRRESAL